MNSYTALEIYHQGPEAVVSILMDQARQINLLTQTVKEQEIRIAKLSKDSTNSSKPPSSDVIGKPKREQGNSKRNIGGQKGHPIHERQPFPPKEINHPHDYHLEICPICKHAGDIIWLPDYEPKKIQQIEIREVFWLKKKSTGLMRTGAITAGRSITHLSRLIS